VLVQLNALGNGPEVTRDLKGSAFVERAQKSFEDAIGTILTVADVAIAAHGSSTTVRFGEHHHGMRTANGYGFRD
jgi:hypothetical protein